MARSEELNFTLDRLVEALARGGESVEDNWNTIFHGETGFNHTNDPLYRQRIDFMNKLQLKDMEFEMIPGPVFKIKNSKTGQFIEASNRMAGSGNELRGQRLRDELLQQRAQDPTLTLKQAMTNIVRNESPLIEAARTFCTSAMGDETRAPDNRFTLNQFNLLVKVATYAIDQRRAELNKKDLSPAELAAGINMGDCHEAAIAFAPIMDLLDTAVPPEVQPFMQTLKQNLTKVISKIAYGEIIDQDRETECLRAIDDAVKNHKNVNVDKKGIMKAVDSISNIHEDKNIGIVNKIRNAIINLFKHHVLFNFHAHSDESFKLRKNIKTELFGIKKDHESPPSTPQSVESKSIEDDEDEDGDGEHPSP